ncbi:MAG: DUF502 domain-containing protein [Pseudomonadota bacterium]
MMAALRRYLIAGLLVWVPLGVTILVIKLFVDLLDGILAVLPEAWQPDQLLGFHIPGLGIVLVTLFMLLTGMVVRNLFGRQLIRLGEQLLDRIPLVRSIYGAVKQITESLFSGSGKSFRKVVLVRYPHASSWTLAFQTGDGLPEARAKTGRRLVSVFVPTTPNPTSGFFLMVPEDEVIELDMSIDDGLRMLLSVGVVVPEPRGVKPPVP